MSKQQIFKRDRKHRKREENHIQRMIIKKLNKKGSDFSVQKTKGFGTHVV